MKAHDVLKKAADTGVALYVDGGTLKARGCRQAVETLAPMLRIHKAEIVELLASAQMMAANDPDRWCWPHSSAMTGREIDTMVERTALFNQRGLPALDAELLADKLVVRDRDLDERRLCFECQHLQAKPAYLGRSWPDLRCGNWKASGLCISVLNSGLSEDFAYKLQRCNGFNAVTP